MEKYSHIITELEIDLKRISMTSESMLNTAKSAIKRCRVALVELRWLVVNEGFPDIESEIHFLKRLNQELTVGSCFIKPFLRLRVFVRNMILTELNDT